MAEGEDDRGKRNWFERQVLRHREALKGYVRRLARSEADAQDLEQEALARVYAVEDRERIDNPRAFLLTTAHNVFIQGYRKQKNSPISAVEDFASLSVKEMCASADERLIARERLAAFGEAIDQLPPQARRVFIMRKVFGLSHQEISEALGVSQKTVEKHVGKGLKRCRDYLRARDLYWDDGAESPERARSSGAGGEKAEDA